MHTYSGGTEATAFNPNAIRALKNLGFRIEGDTSNTNPNYSVKFGEGLQTICFSKTFDDLAKGKETKDLMVDLKITKLSNFHRKGIFSRTKGFRNPFAFLLQISHSYPIVFDRAYIRSREIDR